MAANPYDIYKKQEILSAGRCDLLLMLYDGCIKQMKLACIAIEEKSTEGANNALIKAQAIITKLIGDLDMNYEVSESLAQLYDFFNRELAEANIHKDPERIKPVLDMIVDLRNTWQVAILSQRGGIAAMR